MYEIKADRPYELLYASPSGLACKARCSAKFFFEKVLRLRERGSFRTALDYGTCMHCAMAEAYVNPERAIEIFVSEWKKYPHGETDKKRNTARASATIIEFFHQRSMNPPYTPLNPPSGIVESKEKYTEYEAPFLIDIGAKLPLYGKIDRFVSLNIDGTKWVLDYKTSSEVSARVFNNFKTCVQTLSYTLAGSHLTGGIMQGMILELLRTSAVNAEVQWHPLMVKPHWLDTFIEWSKDQISEICMMNEKKAWKKNPAGCAPYGMYGLPGYVCPFEMLCDLNDWREGERFYEKTKWNPLEHLMKGESDDTKLLKS